MNIQSLWEYRGQKRPDFAITPGEGQESVWDYPRPPRIVAGTRRVEVSSGGVLIASTSAAFRILETASPPTFYVPAADVDHGMPSASTTRTNAVSSRARALPVVSFK